MMASRDRIALPARTTALILVDLQNGTVGLRLGPHTGDEVVSRAKALAGRFRAAGSPVVLVNVGFSPDALDVLTAPVDQPSRMPVANLPQGWTDIVDGLAAPSDILITKRQWGAFYGTDLDLQLRRRKVSTIVIAGIATNQAVESTARAAHEHGYAVVVVEDVAAGLTGEMHNFAFKHIFPLMGRVTSADEIAFLADDSPQSDIESGIRHDV